MSFHFTGQATLGAIAKHYLDANSNLRSEAIAQMHRDLLANEQLLRHVVEEIIDLSVKSSIGNSITADRAEIVRKAQDYMRQRQQAATEEQAEGAKGEAGVALTNLLDTPLADGTRLRHATWDQVRAQIDRHANIEAAHGHKKRWLTLLLEHRKTDIVGNDITEERAINLWSDAA